MPHTGIDRSLRDTLKDAPLPDDPDCCCHRGPHHPPRNKGGAYRIHVEDAETSFSWYFSMRAVIIWSVSCPRARRMVSGRVELFDGIPQMVHPDFIVPEEEADDIPRI